MDRLSDYDYHLPPELIAQTPLEDRAASRLLLLDRSTHAIEHLAFRQCVELLRPGDLLVMNDTRVSALRLFGQKPSGGKVEALLLRETGPATYLSMVKPAKSLHVGTRVQFGEDLEAQIVEELDEGLRSLRFDAADGLQARLARHGLVPLPPYIHERLNDPERYQTVYAREAGSAAAPTAGLHFTDEVLSQMRAKRVEVARVTLHVGIDTFRPVQVEDLTKHRMHGEECELPPDTADKIRACQGRIVAVGTTTVRTLESFAIGPRRVRSGRMESRLFIRPGFQFQVVDGMFTNFHLPRTTMLLMISALVSREAILESYRQAVAERYRFLSFGDSMLVL